MAMRGIIPVVSAFLLCASVAPANAQQQAWRASLAFTPAASGWWAGAPDALAPWRWHTREVLAQQARRRRAPGTVLMIVGGAVAAVGILTDESVLIVGGVVVAAAGLYRYLQ